MKLIIYIILFIILIIYINNQSIEHLTNSPDKTLAYLSPEKHTHGSITDYKSLVSPPTISINNTKHPSMSMHNPYISINQYNANYNPYFKSHLNNFNYDNVVSYNDANVVSYNEPTTATISDSYRLNPDTSKQNINYHNFIKPNVPTASAINAESGMDWVVKDTGYSDIFNNEDIGGDQINNILNTPKPVVFLDKTMTNINTQTPMGKPKWFNPTIVDAMGTHNTRWLNPAIINPNGLNPPIDNIKMPHVNMLNEDLDDIYHQVNQNNNKEEMKDVYSDTIIDNNNTYHLLGTAYNHVYNQYYLLYESIKKQTDDNVILKDNMSNMKLQLYDYALVQQENNKRDIKYIFGPRDKININDIVYFHKGFIKLGPFIINNI